MKKNCLDSELFISNPNLSKKDLAKYNNISKRVVAYTDTKTMVIVYTRLLYRNKVISVKDISKIIQENRSFNIDMFIMFPILTFKFILEKPASKIYFYQLQTNDFTLERDISKSIFKKEIKLYSLNEIAF